MGQVVRFEAELRVEGRTATYVEVPPDDVAVLGAKRAPVVARIGGASVRTTMFTYGEQSFIPVNRGFRTAAGVTAGDVVAVELEADDAPRTVEVPDDLARLLAAAAPAARETWEALSFTSRRGVADGRPAAGDPGATARPGAPAAPGGRAAAVAAQGARPADAAHSPRPAPQRAPTRQSARSVAAWSDVFRAPERNGSKGRLRARTRQVFRPILHLALRTHVPPSDDWSPEQALAPRADARGRGYGPGVRHAW